MFKKFILSLTIKCLGALISLFFLVILGRYYGPEIAGQVSVWLSIAFVGSAIARLGIDPVILREGSRLFRSEDEFRLRELALNSFALSIIGALIVAATIIVFVILSDFADPLFGWYILAALAILFVSINNVTFQLLQAQTKTPSAMFVLTVLPQLLLSLAVALPRTLSGMEFRLFAALVVSSIMTLVFIRFVFPIDMRLISLPALKKLTQLAFPFAIGVLPPVLLSGAAILFANPFIEDQQIGILSAAIRLGALMSFVFVAMHGYVSAKMSRDYHSNDFLALRSSFNRSTMIMAVFGLPILATIFILGDRMLGFIGPGFDEGFTCLRILVLANYLVLLVGPASTFLAMTSQYRTYKTVMVVSVVAQTVLIPLGTIIYGKEGAAAGLAAAIVAQNGLAFFYSRRHLSFLQRQTMA